MGERYPREHPRGTFLYEQINAMNPPLGPQLARDRASLGGPERPARAGALTREQVERLAVPTLFLVGGDDPLVPPALMRMTAALVPGAEYVEVPGSGHSVYFEDATAFNARVGALLDRYAT